MIQKEANTRELEIRSILDRIADSGKALDKASEVLNERMANTNEWRKALDDLVRGYITSAEAHLIFDRVKEDIEKIFIESVSIKPTLSRLEANLVNLQESSDKRLRILEDTQKFQQGRAALWSVGGTIMAIIFSAVVGYIFSHLK